FVDSVNQLFSRPANPFVIKEIAYHESKAAVDSRGLLLDDVVQPAMNWWQIHEADIAGLQGEKIQVRIAQSVATEIARMLQLISQGRLKDDEGVLLQAKDIAVLVNTHNQGKLMRDALEQRGISCMQRTNESVFATDEAVDLKRILQAVVEPARSGRVRAALATVTLGYDAQQIAALDHNDPLWQNVLNKFADYAVFWREHGFAYMWRRLIQDFDVENRLLRLKRGQRRLSNFRHLADLIQGESLRRHGRFEEILVWLTQQQNRKGQQDGNLLRLESDENLVTIMTIHVSKGLQFPVVFCPFLFTAVPPKTSPVAKFNDKQNGPTLDLGTDNLDASSREELRERIAEQVRLDYVALTRAKLACYSVWGVSESEEKNKDAGLNWLLHYGESSEDAVTMLSPTRDCDVSERLQALASPGVNIVPLPAVKQEIVNPGDENNLKLAPRVLHTRVAAGWRLSSFSSLSALSEMEPRDYDAGKSRDVADPIEPAGIFAFPRGARAGQCIHSLFENIDFSDDAGKIQPVAERALAQSGYDLSFASVLAEMAFNVLHCNLGNARELYLRDIASQARVNEMEFYFPVEPMRASGLRAALGEFGSGTAIEKRLDALNFRMREGFMHGFIDLVFEADGMYFLADYKSNWLGGDGSFYHADALEDEIARHDYYLQYLIYSVALHRHLSLCLPDYDYQKHFGGAYYLFVRGMSPDSTNKNGIYFDRPVPGLISRLDNLFAGRPATS
ncbi:MAG: hypothetical protein KJO35_06120, partial [Gammaproteobacteria bacterium]|nr:hypothetical protein [Gammaproteobacteria bacterium]